MKILFLAIALFSMASALPQRINLAPEYEIAYMDFSGIKKTIAVPSVFRVRTQNFSRRQSADNRHEYWPGLCSLVDGSSGPIHLAAVHDAGRKPLPNMVG